MTPLLSVAEAQSRLFALAPVLALDDVPLRDAAGRWAVDRLAARRTQPAHDLSAMDGYAVAFAGLPGPFTMIGESAAGAGFAGSVGAAESVRIFTGAPIPAGCDTVVIQEDVARVGDRVMLIGNGPSAVGRNARRKGLDFITGDTLVSPGERLTPARIGLLATGGYGRVSVRRRLRLALIATGNELVEPGSATDPSKLPESNGLMLTALLADLPVDVVTGGIVADRLDATIAAFRSIDADILVTTGGASVGDHDLVRPGLLAAGGTIEFWKLALRPGKPMLAGRLGNAVILGLPGNPVSAFVTGFLFLRPLIAAMAGATDPLPRQMSALLGEAVAANDHRADYLRATLCAGRLHPAPVQDSSMLRALADADALIIRPPHAPALPSGSAVGVHLL